MLQAIESAATPPWAGLLWPADPSDAPKDAWGNLEIDASEPGYAFTGREWDPEVGLYYYRARYYDPKGGRFISEDPIGFGGGTNFFGYVNGNPTGFTDPQGLQEYGPADLDSVERARAEMRAIGMTDDDIAAVRGDALEDQTVDIVLTVVPGPAGEAASMATPGGVLRDAVRSACGPSGRRSLQKYLAKRWDKGTFGALKKSIEYHYRKHVAERGLDMSLAEYTQRAIRAFRDGGAKFVEATDKSGRQAWKVVSEFGVGLYTKAGKIIWFDPK